MKQKPRTKADSVTVRISRKARKQLKLSAVKAGVSFIEYVDRVSGVK